MKAFRIQPDFYFVHGFKDVLLHGLPGRYLLHRPSRDPPCKTVFLSLHISLKPSHTSSALYYLLYYTFPVLFNCTLQCFVFELKAETFIFLCALVWRFFPASGVINKLDEVLNLGLCPSMNWLFQDQA